MSKGKVTLGPVRDIKSLLYALREADYWLTEALDHNRLGDVLAEDTPNREKDIETMQECRRRINQMRLSARAQLPKGTSPGRARPHA